MTRAYFYVCLKSILATAADKLARTNLVEKSKNSPKPYKRLLVLEVGY